MQDHQYCLQEMSFKMFQNYLSQSVVCQQFLYLLIEIINIEWLHGQRQRHLTNFHKRYFCYTLGAILSIGVCLCVCGVCMSLPQYQSSFHFFIIMVLQGVANKWDFGGFPSLNSVYKLIKNSAFVESKNGVLCQNCTFSTG